MTDTDSELYYYDEEAAERVVIFFESYLTLTGEYMGKPFLLADWQKEMLQTIFGWKKKANGKRKYTHVYLEIARKNGKSQLAAGIALYMLIADGNKDAQIYSAANSRDQSKFVFNMATRMAHGIKHKVKNPIIVNKHSVEYGFNFYKSISAEAGTIHGANPTCIIYDELHCARDGALYEALNTAMGARDEPLFIMTTTAGHDKTSLCYQQHEYAEKVRDGIIEDPTFLPVLFCADPGDDISDEATWRKANPNFDVIKSIKPTLEREHRKAISSPVAMTSFRKLYLSQWTESQQAWLNVSTWRANTVDTPDLTDAQLYLGLDLAYKRDITALIELYVLGDGTYYVRPHFFCPESQLEDAGKSGKMDYRQWVKDQHLIATPGDITDYTFVEDLIYNINKTHTITELIVDPYNATHLMTRLWDNGIEVIEQPSTQTARLHDTHRELEALVEAGCMTHDGNPVMDWMVSNVQIQINKDDNIVLKKGMSVEKIDGVVALALALSRARLCDHDQYNENIKNSGAII